MNKCRGFGCHAEGTELFDCFLCGDLPDPDPVNPFSLAPRRDHLIWCEPLTPLKRKTLIIMRLIVSVILVLGIISLFLLAIITLNQST